MAKVSPKEKRAAAFVTNSFFAEALPLDFLKSLAMMWSKYFFIAWAAEPPSSDTIVTATAREGRESDKIRVG